MKKISVIGMLIVILFLTGCGSSTKDDLSNDDGTKSSNVEVKQSSGETVTCLIDRETEGIKMNEKLTITFKEDKIVSASSIGNVTLDSNFLDYRDEILDSFKKDVDDSNFENVSIEKTSNGFKISYSMNENNFKVEYDYIPTKSELIDELEEDGYDCN